MLRALSSHRIHLIALVSLLVLAVACSERGPSGPGTGTTRTDRLVACVADLHSVTLSCGMPSAPGGAGSRSGVSSDLIVGGQGTNVELSSTNVSYDAASAI